MNFKRKLLAIVAGSTFVCSSAFAEGFYAKVGGAGAMSMKPDMFTSGEANIVPNLYVGFGMNVIDGVRIGVEGSGWMPATKVAEKVTASSKELHLKDSLSISAAAYYDIEVSDSMVPFAGVRVGYAKGTFGLNEANDKDEKIKNAVLKYAEYKPLTFGGSLGVGIKILDSASLDVGYNLDYYSLVPTTEAKERKVSGLVEKFSSTDASTSFFVHKMSAGITFRF